MVRSYEKESASNGKQGYFRNNLKKNHVLGKHWAMKTLWKFHVKSESHGHVTRFCPRLVALGKYQKPGVDYDESFSPVVRMALFRMILGLTVLLSLQIDAVDFSTAYVSADLTVS